MVPIVFHNEQVRRILAAIEEGRPIEASSDGWTVADMLMVAGAMHYALMAHGPSLNGRPTDFARLPQEHQEAFAETYQRELASAIETCSRLACDLHSGASEPGAAKLVGRVITLDGEPLVEVGASGRKAA